MEKNNFEETAGGNFPATSAPLPAIKQAKLKTIANRIQEVNAWVTKICGNKEKVIPIETQARLVSAQENSDSLGKLKKEIEAIFEPEKKEKRAVWQAAVDEEKSWKEPIEKIGAFLDAQILDFMRRERERAQEEERKQLEAQAARDREALDKEKASAAAAGNTEAVAEIEAIKESVIVGPVPERQVINRTSVGTVSDKIIVDYFKITDHMVLAQWLIDTQKGAFIILDDKTLTALNKFIISNPSLTAIPGYEFRRGYGLNKRSARG